MLHYNIYCFLVPSRRTRTKMSNFYAFLKYSRYNCKVVLNKYEIGNPYFNDNHNKQFDDVFQIRYLL